MKTIKKYMVLGGLSLGLLFSACTDDEKLPDPLFASDVPTNGAYLKTLSSSFQIDFLDINSSEFNVTLEEHDRLNDGTLIQDVQVYTRFNDQTVDTEGVTPDPLDDIDNTKEEVLFETIPASAFTINSNGQPEVAYTAAISDAMTSLGLVLADLDITDRFFFRFVLNLTDGNSYSVSNTGSSVVSQPVFNSPFEYSSIVNCAIDDETYMVGTYLLEEISGANPFGSNYGPQFGTQMVEITFVSSTERSFDFAYFPDRFASDYRMEINLVCNELFLFSTANSGTLGCSGGASTIEGVENPDIVSPYDLSDDSSFTLNLRDFFNDAACGTGTTDMVLTLTKQ